MTKLKHDKGCRCIFCNMLCRACGSTNIEVEAVARYLLTNNKKDRLCFGRDVVALHVTCKDCGASHAARGGERTRPHKKLLRQIHETIFPGLFEVSIDDGGDIKTKPFLGMVRCHSAERKRNIGIT